MSSEQYSAFHKSLAKIKMDIFGTEKIILHALELTRTRDAKQKELKIIAHPDKRRNFYYLLNELITKTDCKVFGFVIHKPTYAKQYGGNSPEPYFLAFGNILRQFIAFLTPREKGIIQVEQRSKILDKQFLLAWESAKLTGIQGMKGSELSKHKIITPEILGKSWENSGLEIADLICYRLARYYMGKPEKPEGNELDLKTIKNKNLITITLPSGEYIPGLK